MTLSRSLAFLMIILGTRVDFASFTLLNGKFVIIFYFLKCFAYV